MTFFGEYIGDRDSFDTPPTGPLQSWANDGFMGISKNESPVMSLRK